MTDDLISRQQAIDMVHKNYDTILDFTSDGRTMADSFEDIISALPSVRLKYTKADYIMALHKEYGCTLIKAEEAHNKALEFLQNEAKMKG